MFSCSCHGTLVSWGNHTIFILPDKQMSCVMSQLPLMGSFWPHPVSWAVEAMFFARCLHQGSFQVLLGQEARDPEFEMNGLATSGPLEPV